MSAARLSSITLGGKRVEYRLVRSKTARKLRVRVGLDGVEVVQPGAKEGEEVESFLHSNSKWIVGQLERVDCFGAVRKAKSETAGEVLYRGMPTPVRVEHEARRQGTNQVVFENGCLVVVRGRASVTSPVNTLENWLRKQAREEIMCLVDTLTPRIKRSSRKVYIMGQRTKWGNCSALHNLSFNWRLIMAPDFVLRYLVTHEVVHLAVPDHSHRFWLTVQSLCPHMERARQWLVANTHQLQRDLRQVCEG